MDAYSSGGEDVVIKTRKPYTITKQRERWTEEEHNRFLEALKLYGRAWQRIEEHIGTKTAVQIRSHAQKFFSKLEKEAVAKGVPVGETMDIEIPPPRPKRKPNNPYPRKIGVCSTSSQAGGKDGKSVITGLNLEDPSLIEKSNDGEKLTEVCENQDDNCSGVFSALRDTHCSSITSTNKIMMPKDQKISTMTNEQIDKSDSAKEDCILKSVKQKNQLPTQNEENVMESIHNYPRHVPIHVVDGIPPEKMFNPNWELHGQNSQFVYPNDQQDGRSSFVTVPPFRDDYRSFLQMSSAFSSLILSLLTQNPAAHAAASFAANFWPYGGAADSSTCENGGFQATPPPNIAAIASSTVAAATAWWAAHGLMPLCAPIQRPPFGCPASAAPISCMDYRDVSETKADNVSMGEKHQLQDCHLEAEQSTVLPAQKSISKETASSDSEESRLPKEVGENEHKEEEMAANTPDVNDSTKTKMRNQAYRSSCGSNTTSSSEVETDVLGKHGKDKEDSNDADVNQLPSGDSNNRRARVTTSSSDSRKEVSEEGRLAFQALFSMEVLPQSFSLRHEMKSKMYSDQAESSKERESEKNGEDSLLDLNVSEEVEKSACISCDNDDEGLLTIGLGNGKFKCRRTGFKPYKRCSFDAKDCRMTSGSQGEEKCSKRIRLEGEALS